MKKFAWVDDLNDEDLSWMQSYLRNHNLSVFIHTNSSDIKHRLSNLEKKHPANGLIIRKLEAAYRTRRSRQRSEGKIACVTISKNAEQRLNALARRQNKKFTEVLDSVLDEKLLDNKQSDRVAREELIEKFFKDGGVFKQIMSSADKLSGLNKKIIRQYDQGLDEALSHALLHASVPEGVDKERIKLVCENAIRYLNAKSDDYIAEIERHHADLRKQCTRQFAKANYRMESLTDMRLSQLVADGREDIT